MTLLRALAALLALATNARPAHVEALADADLIERDR